ncbi:MAG TPA: cytochrome o ubiquinol oxidase subunit III [Nevskiaceae bacterium]|nr:cytochrome o ubiquinol oxidase subunit III [Nevskiaceae bacterium]
MSMIAAEVEARTDDALTFYVQAEDHPKNGVLFGFWLYLMSDAFIFACLFACYAVLGRHYNAGPTGHEVFDLSELAVSTGALLLSSVTYGFAMLEMARKHKAAVLGWLAIAGLFALLFLGLEIHEFTGMVAEGAGPDRSAFLSSFFALVGTHGLHVTFGCLWLATVMVQVGRYGLTDDNCRRLNCLSLFWHFLDLVWIGVFSVVYLIGVM